jgi:predicted PurR-regulated permease PerM
VKTKDDRAPSAGPEIGWLKVPAALLTLLLVVVLLKIGQPVLLPILLAVIAVYVLVETEAALARLPGLGRLPRVVLRGLVLVLFLALLSAFGLVIDGTLREIAAAAPRYEANLDAMIAGLADRFGIDGAELWEKIANEFAAAVDFQRMISRVLLSLGNFGVMLFLVAIYASFLMAERVALPEKLSRAFASQENADRAARIVAEINEGIGTYLATKTLINVILGILSYGVLVLFGVDFALFWALLIALLNYIPYLGSYIGVAFPVVLSLAQFGQIGTTLLLTGCLTAAQLFVGNWLEPKLIGRSANLSPFVVLAALAAWSALWGIPGAIFAVPLTSMIAIICGAFAQTRWVPILLSQDARRLDRAQREATRKGAA